MYIFLTICHFLELYYNLIDISHHVTYSNVYYDKKKKVFLSCLSTKRTSKTTYTHVPPVSEKRVARKFFPYFHPHNTLSALEVGKKYEWSTDCHFSFSNHYGVRVGRN